MAYDIQSILSELNIEVSTNRLVNGQVYHKLSGLWDILPPAASPLTQYLPPSPSLFLDSPWSSSGVLLPAEKCIL